MKKIYLAFLFLISIFAHAQVGYGTPTPDKSAAIEILAPDKGILIPRVELTSDTQKLQSSINNANALLVFNNGAALTHGFYYWKANFNNQNENDGTGKWIALGSDFSSMPKFFYMPSIIINTSVNGTFKRNLYAEYKAQFTGKEFILNSSTGGDVGANNSLKFVKSTGGSPETTAPNEIPFVLQPADLWYYITDYDATALSSLTIDANGILTYTVIGSGTDYSFVNIVFVVK